MIDFTKYKPDQIRYDDKGVWVGEEFIPSDNPRLEFARVLGEFPDDSHMRSWSSGCWVRTNTKLARDPISTGSNCVIGGNGFGYERDENGFITSIPHRGDVKIGYNVSLGSNVCIDRAVLGSTVIGNSTKIDNNVHVAHGVKIGNRCLIAAGAVIGGSAEVGDNCFIGINASIKNKVKIGKGCTIGMAAVVTKDVPDGATVIGVNKILNKKSVFAAPPVTRTGGWGNKHGVIIMTCIAVKIKEKHIEIAGDSQATWGRNKYPNPSYADKTLKAEGKIFQTNGMTIGCAGSVAHIGLLQIYCKTHKPKEMDRDSIIDWFIEFRDWVNIRAKIPATDISIHAILINDGRAFAFYDFMEVSEIKDFEAVGSGMFLAIGAMELGADVEKAIEVAIKYDLFCGGDITKIIVE